MFTITAYVPANEIWPTAQNHEDKGFIKGYHRGYNIEVETVKGETAWLSCDYIEGLPETDFDTEFYRWYFLEHQWTPTGRVCFRGYAVKRYDSEIGDFCMQSVSDNEII